VVERTAIILTYTGVKKHMTKKCSLCKQVLPLNEFGFNRSTLDGRMGWCRMCVKVKRSTPEYKEKSRERTARYAEKNKSKVKSRLAIKHAIEAGKLQRKPCEICGSSENIQAHHEDYSKPFDVIWLCLEHHNWIHCKVGRG
jgi:hypothetical protein